MWCAYGYVHKHMNHTKHEYVQIILALTSTSTVFCIDDVTNSLHIMEHLAMHQ